MDLLNDWLLVLLLVPLAISAVLWGRQFLHLLARLLGAGSAVSSAVEETNGLLASGLPFAKKSLSEGEWFYPFAFALSAEYVTTAVAVDPGVENPTPETVRDELVAALRAGAARGEYRACALFRNTKVEIRGARETSEAISVGLEHVSGYSLDIHLPYVRTPEGGIQLQKTHAYRREAQFFEQGRSRWRKAWLRLGWRSR